MKKYFCKVKGWPVELGAKTLPRLKKFARQYAKEMLGTEVKNITLVEVYSYEEKYKKMKPIKIKL